MGHLTGSLHFLRLFLSPWVGSHGANDDCSIESDVLAILGSDYSSGDVTYYISSNYTTQDYLPQFVKQSDIFQAGLANCTIA